MASSVRKQGWWNQNINMANNSAGVQLDIRQNYSGAIVSTSIQIRSQVQVTNRQVIAAQSPLSATYNVNLIQPEHLVPRIQMTAENDFLDIFDGNYQLEMPVPLQMIPPILVERIKCSPLTQEEFQALKARQKIKKTYHRRLAVRRLCKKTKKKRVTFGKVTLVEFHEESDNEGDVGQESGQLKRLVENMKHADTSGLRRSQRISALTQGHRTPPAPSQPSSSASPVNRAKRSASQAKGMCAPSSEFPGPVKFPSLTDLDDLEDTYPEIQPTTLQAVAVEICGVPLEEATLEQLMMTSEQEAEDVSCTAISEGVIND